MCDRFEPLYIETTSWYSIVSMEALLVPPDCSFEVE